MVDHFPGGQGQFPEDANRQPSFDLPFSPNQQLSPLEMAQSSAAYWQMHSAYFHTETQTQAAQISALNREATQNPVTGLYNEVGFDLRLAEVRAAYPDLPIAIIEIDLGKFKSINDTLGHTAGDEVLRTVGNALRRTDAETLVGHPHGDEFRVAAPLYARENTDLSNQERMAVIIDRIKLVGNQLCVDKPLLKELGFSVSAGGAILEPGMRLEEVIPVADQAMYADKRALEKALFKELPIRKKIAHYAGIALLRYSGTKQSR